MKKKNVIPANYLEKVPQRNPAISWSCDDSGAVTLEIVNKGVFHRLAQILLKKPKISYVHLDKNGSFVWPLIDGERDLIAIGALVHEHFGEQAEPLYERLATFFRILESYGFIRWVT